MKARLRRARVGALAIFLLATAAALAQGVGDTTEIELWKAITARGLKSDYAGYLRLYPNGRFAPLARLRAGDDAPPPAAPTPAPNAPPLAGKAAGWLQPASPRVRLVDGVVLDTDATGLRAGSNHRIVVMPAASPDEITDQDRFLENSIAIPIGRQHLTIPAGPAGADEVRLYYIPPYGSAFTVGARAPVFVEPGVPGATLARTLVREALRLGPIRFEAAHRDRPSLVQAAFLRARPRTEWNVRWFGDVPIGDVPRQAAVISVGQPGAIPDEHGSTGEIVCVLPASSRAVLDRIAALQTGDPVLVTGVPYAWTELGSEPLLLDRCSFAN